jgi:hypothetical protein
MEVRVRLPYLLLALCLAGLAGNASAADVTRTLRAEVTGADVGRFGVENLAGLMRVTPGSGNDVVAVATVHAESDELASSIRFERVTGEHGRPVLRVRYPLDRHTEYRYPGGNSDGGLLMGLFPGARTDTKYEGQRVHISGKKGVLLYADVEVQVPRSRVAATFRNGAGPMEAHDVEGELRFETGYGPVRLTKTAGDVVADTGSGDVDATDSQGALKCDTGSGECVVTGFSGDRLVCDTGSGKVRVSSTSARSIEVDSGSGNVVLEDADAEDLKVDTGSGNVDVQSPGRRLAHIKADTGSGNVKLRLSADAGFEAHADIGSGDIVNHYPDAQAIVKRREVVGYRRGDGRIRIDVDTGSGDLVLEPGK